MHMVVKWKLVADLAIDLISWDALYKYIDIDDLTDIEDTFCDDN